LSARSGSPLQHYKGRHGKGRACCGGDNWEVEDEADETSDSWYEPPPKRQCHRGRGGGSLARKVLHGAGNDRASTATAAQREAQQKKEAQEKLDALLHIFHAST
jgi:hypothetical protein